MPGKSAAGETSGMPARESAAMATTEAAGVAASVLGEQSTGSRQGDCARENESRHHAPHMHSVRLKSERGSLGVSFFERLQIAVRVLPVIEENLVLLAGF